MLNNYSEQYPYSSEDLIQMITYTAGGQPEYIGRARPGTSAAASAWQIAKYTYDGSGRVVSKLFAGGTNEFSSVWNDRASLSYA